MIGVHSALSPVIISEYDDKFELLTVEIKVANREIRIISGYGPQESWAPQERESFFNALEKEVITAELAGKSIIVIADFISKLGPAHVPNDPHLQDRNGALLAGTVGRQKLIVGNGLMKCKGTITRKRVTT